MHILATIRGSNYSLEFGRINSQDESLRTILMEEGMDLTPVNGWHPKRQKEWIAGRFLIKENLNHPMNQLLISSNGKPYFQNSAIHFSLSHSSDLIGIGISDRAIGIDIQVSSPAIEKTAHKFISEYDMNAMKSSYSPTEKKHFIWTIKEAIFKSYGLGKVDFKNAIQIKNASTFLNTDTVRVELILENIHTLYNVDLFRLGNYYIAVAIPEN